MTCCRAVSRHMDAEGCRLGVARKLWFVMQRLCLHLKLAQVGPNLGQFQGSSQLHLDIWRKPACMHASVLLGM